MPVFSFYYASIDKSFRPASISFWGMSSSILSQLLLVTAMLFNVYVFVLACRMVKMDSELEAKKVPPPLFDRRCKQGATDGQTLSGHLVFFAKPPITQGRFCHVIIVDLRTSSNKLCLRPAVPKPKTKE